MKKCFGFFVGLQICLSGFAPLIAKNDDAKYQGHLIFDAEGHRISPERLAAMLQSKADSDSDARNRVLKHVAWNVATGLVASQVAYATQKRCQRYIEDSSLQEDTIPEGVERWIKRGFVGVVEIGTWWAVHDKILSWLLRPISEFVLPSCTKEEEKSVTGITSSLKWSYAFARVVRDLTSEEKVDGQRDADAGYNFRLGLGVEYCSRDHHAR